MTLKIKSLRKYIAVKKYLLNADIYKIYMLASLGIFSYVLFLYLISLIVFNEVEPNENITRFANVNIFGKIFAILILAPVLETFIFQFLMIEGLLLIKFFKRRVFLITIVSAFAFGLSHFFGIYYIIYAFGISVIFNTFYLLLKFRQETAFLHVFFLHSMLNLFVFVVGYF